MNVFDAIFRQIRREADGLAAATRDEDLLGRFVADRDEAAFEELLRRYGPMVMGVARRTMPERAAAEDVFQATFLALVGRAGTIRRREAVGTWLARVAFQTAKRALRDTARGRSREMKSAHPEAAPAAPEFAADADGLGVVLDEELNRLPEKYRQALVLCCVLEKPFAEAARELGLSAPAVWKRVRKGQDMLRRRLDARGVAVASVTVAAVLAGGGAGRADVASAIPGIIRSAAAVLSGAAEGIPARVVALAGAEAAAGGRTVRTGLIVAIGLVSVGAAGYASLSSPPTRPAAPPVAVRPDAVVPPSPAIGVELAGVVRGPDGRPSPGARVTVLAKEYARGEGGGTDRVLATAVADAAGHYRLTVPPFAAPVAEVRKVKVLTADRGGAMLAATEVNLPPGTTRVAQDFAVAAGRTIRGRVLDPFGLPVPGAKVAVARIGAASIDAVVGAPESVPPGWPAGAVTDAAGAFEVGGLDPAAEVKLTVDPRDHSFAAVVVPADKTDPVVIPVGPARRIVGRVTAAATGDPVTHARLIVTSPARSDGTVGGRRVRADAHGRYAVTLPDGDRFEVQAHAPDGVPLLPVSEPVTFAPRERSATVDLALIAGVALRGEVRDADGAPVAGAIVQHVSRAGAAVPGVVSGGAGFATAAPDGRFAAVVPSGHGTLLVFGPSLEFRPETSDLGELRTGTPDGTPVYAHAVVPLTIDVGAGTPAVRVTLTRGVGIDLRVLAPDGTPLADGAVICRHLAWPFEFRTSTAVPVRNGVARLPGCVPGRRYSVAIADADQTCGAITEVVCPAGPASDPVTVRLRAAGEVTGRVVRADAGSPRGTPYRLMLQLPRDVPDDPAARATRVSDSISGVFAGGNIRAAGAPIGADGRVRLPGLIPGARYRFGVLKGGNWTWLEFEIAAGKAADLPAIVVE